MSKKVYCIAQFLPKEGKEAELFSVLQSLEPSTCREDGCLKYIVTRKHALRQNVCYSTVEESLFVFISLNHRLSECVFGKSHGVKGLRLCLFFSFFRFSERGCLLLKYLRISQTNPVPVRPKSK